jgi:uncharacterized membrane protein
MAISDQQLERAMGRMLQIGVTIAALVVLAGGVLRLAQAPRVASDYRHFHGAPPAFEHAGSIIAAAFHLNGSAVIEFGILLLIATPICRVLFGVVGFALMKDRLYTLVSAFVLVILLSSFFFRK